MRRHALAIAALGLVVVLAAAARAHGPAPVALSVLRLAGDAPAAVHSNIGLATANGDGTYAYVCPSRWDGNERALAYGSADGGAIMVQSLGVAYLSTDGACAFEAAPLDGYVIATAPWSDGFAALVEDDAGARRVEGVGPGGETTDLGLALPASPDGLLGAGDALWVAGAGPPLFAARWDGATLEVVYEGALPGEPSRAVPVAAGADAVWLETSGADLALVRVDGSGLGAPRAFERARHGPILHEGRWLALFDGELHASVDGTWASLGERAWTCLESRAGRSFACSLEGTVELVGDAPQAAPFFSMRQLTGPTACGSEAAQIECEREWAHFGGESGWLETEAATDPVSERRVSGCTAAPGRSAEPGRTGGAALLGLLLALAWARRAASRSQ